MDESALMGYDRFLSIRVIHREQGWAVRRETDVKRVLKQEKAYRRVPLVCSLRPPLAMRESQVTTTVFRRVP
jgi:hypothetical protein